MKKQWNKLDWIPPSPGELASLIPLRRRDCTQGYLFLKGIQKPWPTCYAMSLQKAESTWSQNKGVENGPRLKKLRTTQIREANVGTSASHWSSELAPANIFFPPSGPHVKAPGVSTTNLIHRYVIIIGILFLPTFILGIFNGLFNHIMFVRVLWQVRLLVRSQVLLQLQHA